MNPSFVQNFRLSVRSGNWRKMVLAAAFLTGLATASPALATSTGLQALGGSVNAIDVWTFTCPAGVGVRARANVFDVAPINNPAFMQVVLGKAGFVSAQATDVLPVPFGEGGVSSPTAQVIGGSGLYTVAFKKTSTGTEGYVGTVVCCNVAGVCINPPLSRSINQ